MCDCCAVEDVSATGDGIGQCYGTHGYGTRDIVGDGSFQECACNVGRERLRTGFGGEELELIGSVGMTEHRNQWNGGVAADAVIDGGNVVDGISTECGVIRNPGICQNAADVGLFVVVDDGPVMGCCVWGVCGVCDVGGVWGVDSVGKCNDAVIGGRDECTEGACLVG